MRSCSLCRGRVLPGTTAVSIVGGLFPVEDPDFFMVDEAVLSESYAHLECLIEAVSKGQESGFQGSNS